MIKASELRIGNYITDVDSGQMVKIVPIEEEGFEYFQAIPLTEEWLLKAGFKHGELYLNDLIIGNDLPFMRISFINGDGDFGLECQYVHQLQNLCFALTGKELEFKDL